MLVDLPCIFDENILCSHRKYVRLVGVMARCWECRHYRRFMRVMFAVDERVMDEIDKERGTEVSK